MGERFIKQSIKKIKIQDIPGGTVDTNPPANAKDTGPIPGPGGFHVAQSNWAHVPQLLGLSSRAHQPQLLRPHARITGPCTSINDPGCPLIVEAVLYNKGNHCNQKPTHHN